MPSSDAPKIGFDAVGTSTPTVPVEPRRSARARGFGR